MADWIYLDNHTKTHPNREILEQIAQVGGTHWFLNDPEKPGREIVTLLGAKKRHFQFVSFFDLLFSHYVHFIRETGRTHILTLENEDPKLLEGIRVLEKFEVKGKLLPTDEKGRLTKKLLQENVRARSSLLSISLAHPKTGVIQPIHDIIEVCKENEIKIHLDVSTALGKLYFQAGDLDVDYLTFNGNLIHAPEGERALISKVPFSSEKVDYARAVGLQAALEKAIDGIDSMCMEVGRLRALLEEKIEAEILFSDAERLPNTVCAKFKVHGHYLCHELKKRGVFATSYGEYLCLALSAETTEAEIDQASTIINETAKELGKAPKLFTDEEAKAKNMRLCEAKLSGLTLSLLIDEEDGVVADAKCAVYGPYDLVAAANAACKLLLRKNYMQARRLTAELIEKEVGILAPNALNFVIDAIDEVTEECMDIPIEDVYIAPPDMGKGERTVYPNWEKLSDAQKKAVLSEVVEKDIQPYVELDAGGVEVVKVVDNRVTIAYSGSCTSCHSATGATLDAIGNILRHKIYPDLMVMPDLSLLER